MNSAIMKASLKKELWEFSGVFKWVPIILASVFIFIPLLVFILNGLPIESIITELSRISQELGQLSQSQQTARLSEIFFVSAIALFTPFITIGFIVQVYYLTNCLFDERRDLSVMFWRSLPVSDGVTIACKLITGALIIPVIFFAAATLLVLIILVLVVVASVILSVGYDISLWGWFASASILSGIGYIWLSLVPTAIWLLPFYSWLMLASVYAKKAPFLWAVLPIVTLLIIEAIAVHYLNLSQAFFGHFIVDYFSMTPDDIGTVTVGAKQLSFSGFQSVIAKIDYRTLLISVSLLGATYWYRVNKSEL
ncbi:ABC transporter permease [Colwelliaceae bacterium MEBiC 14330]